MTEKITLEEALRQNKELREEVARLTEIVNYLQKQLFGKKTEKLSSGQLNLFDGQVQETASEQDSSAETRSIVVASHQRKCKPQKSREQYLNSLEQVEELHKLTKQELTCVQCGELMKVIGKHEMYREVKMIPAHLQCKVVCTETAKCDHCQDSQTGNDVLVQAETPQPLFPHSYLSSSVIAEVLFQKFGLAVPFTRQIQYWQKLGLPITSKHMARGVIESAERFGQEIYNRFKQEIQTAPVVQLDETLSEFLISIKLMAISGQHVLPKSSVHIKYHISITLLHVREKLLPIFWVMIFQVVSCAMVMVATQLIVCQKHIGEPA